MNSEIIKTLNMNSIVPTPMRMLVLEQLLLQTKNLSLTDIETLLYPADRITIYRTLQTFVKKGLIHIIETPQGHLYALCSDECSANSHSDNHPHFFCEQCKTVSCNNDFTVTIKGKPNVPQYRVDKIEINVKGICPDCLKA